MPKILLAEDNEMIRELMTERLEGRGFDVQQAANGQAALAQVALGQPDLILLDLDMPVLNGWDTARQLKDTPATAAIPIIAFTAHAITGERERALAAGCNEYETKPVNLERLLAKIQLLLTQSGFTQTAG